MLRDILNLAQTHNASDVHLIQDRKPVYRLIGDLVEMDHPIIDHSNMQKIVEMLIDLGQQDTYNQGNDVDGAYTDESGNRYRLNLFHQSGKMAIAIRLLRQRVPSLDELKLPEILKNLAMLPRGLVLVTGPTGSGKSTTLAAMIRYINEHKQHHILTLEDPIEYIHQPQKCMINQREVHKDVKDFQSALRSALREDPDVILVGEMRDHETISLALTAAETGHLVFSTLHTTGAASTIDRIIDVFPPHQQSQVRSQLSGVLKGVLSQALLPKADKSGRVAVHEIMVMTDAIGNLIRENKIVQINSVIQTGSRQGMQSLEGGLAKLVNEGMVTLEDAQTVTSDVAQLKRMMGV